MNSKVLWILVLLLAALAAPACDKGAEGDKGKMEKPAGEKMDGDKKDGAAMDEKKADEKMADEKMADKAPAAAGAVTPESFAAQAPTNLCTWITTCKNEEITTGMNATIGLIVGFGSLAKPDIKTKIEPVMKKMDEEQRKSPTAEECGVLVGAGAELLGMDAKSLKANVDGGKVKFDAAKAATCLENLKGDFKSCQMEKKVEGDVKMSQLETMMEPYKAELEGQLKPCEDALVGAVKAGESCDFDYVCEGGGKCKGKDGAKTCVAAQ